MRELIQENIHDFYDEIGSTLGTGSFKDSTISWMKTDNGLWPNMIYNTSFSENNIDDFVEQNIAAIKTKQAPPFWLVEDSQLEIELSKKLSKKGMRPVFHWTGMGLTVNSPLAIELSSNTTIKTVESIIELNAWLTILNSTLMTSNQIRENIFENLYSQNNIELHLVLENDIPVATGLAYFDDNVCGIYMIATLGEHRRKGYGSAVTKHCINAAHQKGITNIVLQASNKGVSIYEKMGFNKYCEFNILWMLGKDFK
ncbi:MAG: GNAT family N-acetyltransferase [Vicingaceae bacterium]|nr:GNAT family N-acetyltransferase [Vicingaceae bacterium]